MIDESGRVVRLRALIVDDGLARQDTSLGRATEGLARVAPALVGIPVGTSKGDAAWRICNERVEASIGERLRDVQRVAQGELVGWW